MGQSKIDSLRAEYDKMYGLDVFLINGKKNFPENNPVKGHPFWRDQEPFSADIFIAGKTFHNFKLKYNIQKQEFILCYFDYNGQPQQIILNTAVIDSVRTGSFVFVKNNYPKIAEGFTQLIFKGSLSCYKRWHKKLTFQTSGENSGLYEYSTEYQTSYLVREEVVYRFKNKVTFLRIFPKEKKSTIKKYLLAHTLRFRGITDSDLSKIIAFCDEILKTE